MIAPKCKLSVMYVTDLGKTGIIASNGFLDQLSYYNRLRLPKNRHKSKTRLVSVIPSAWYWHMERCYATGFLREIVHLLPLKRLKRGSSDTKCIQKNPNWTKTAYGFTWKRDTGNPELISCFYKDMLCFKFNFDIPKYLSLTTAVPNDICTVLSFVQTDRIYMLLSVAVPSNICTSLSLV